MFFFSFVSFLSAFIIFSLFAKVFIISYHLLLKAALSCVGFHVFNFNNYRIVIMQLLSYSIARDISSRHLINFIFD